MPNTTSNNLTPAIVPAHRVSQVSEYYFSRKLKEIARLNAAGRDIVSLGIGGPDRPPHPTVIETLVDDARRADSHSYQPYVGLPALRQAYSEWYKRFYGVTLDPDKEIQPLIGSKEGILHITLAFVNPGDGVLVPNPGYPTYTSVSRLAEAKIHYYDLTEEGHWLPDFEALEQMDLDGVKLMWVNYPHMPTGASATKQVMQQLVDFGRRHGIVIVNDNPYSFILHRERLSLLAAEGAREVAIEMNSLSKSHNMAGWRMGMVAAQPKFIEWILRVKSNIDSGQFRPMMKAAIEALHAPDEWYAEVNAEYARRRTVAEQIMAALGCHIDPKQGGLFLWGRIPDDYRDAEQLADEVLERARVFIVPGFIFGSRGNRYVRLSLCATVDKLQEALKRINNDMK